MKFECVEWHQTDTPRWFESLRCLRCKKDIPEWEHYHAQVGDHWWMICSPRCLIEAQRS